MKRRAIFVAIVLLASASAALAWTHGKSSGMGASALLLENGSYLLLEDGSKLLLE